MLLECGGIAIARADTQSADRTKSLDCIARVHIDSSKEVV